MSDLSLRPPVRPSGCRQWHISRYPRSAWLARSARRPPPAHPGTAGRRQTRLGRHAHAREHHVAGLESRLARQHGLLGRLGMEAAGETAGERWQPGTNTGPGGGHCVGYLLRWAEASAVDGFASVSCSLRFVTKQFGTALLLLVLVQNVSCCVIMNNFREAILVNKDTNGEACNRDKHFRVYIAVKRHCVQPPCHNTLADISPPVCGPVH